MSETSASLGAPQDSVRVEPRTRLLLPGKTLAAIVAALAMAGLLAALSFLSIRNIQTSSALVDHTTQVTSTLANVLSLLKDAETGQRGFLLTGDEAYLVPYNDARRNLPGELAALKRLISDNPAQAQRVQALASTVEDKLESLVEAIALKRTKDDAAAVAYVRTNRGKLYMDRARQIVADLSSTERSLLAARAAEHADVVQRSFVVTLAGAAVLLAMIVLTGWFASTDFRARDLEAWLRRVQAAAGVRMQGNLGQKALGERALQVLAENLGARVGALYAAMPGGRLERIAGHALEPEAPGGTTIEPGVGLTGQAARDRRLLIVNDLPANYLKVHSTVGSAQPTEVAIVPAVADGDLHGVLELGFFRRLGQADRLLLERMAEPVAIALSAAAERAVRQRLLEETQRQGEELQAQQEELRVSNEELEEQSTALRESQQQLQNQQAELEETNAQLEAQANDLSRQKESLLKAEAAQAAAAAEAERTSRYKSEFLANMSHELRTPLNSSLILSKILADNAGGNLTEEQVKHARVIQASNNDLLALINDILDLSKIEAGHANIEPDTVALEAILDPLRKSFEPLAAQKKLAFRVESSAAPGTTMVTDPRRLQQILRNLLANAIKFTDRGSVDLHVSTITVGRIAFTVRDTGIGIAPEEQESIFEAFRQADGTASRKYGGTGLGLSISRELARLLGGSVRLQSRPGEGSTFMVDLPLDMGQAPAVPRQPVALPEVQPAKRSEARAPAAPAPISHLDDDRENRSRQRLILIVEDDEKFAQILYGLAHEQDFDCVHTASGSEAIQLAKDLKPSGILMDIGLPDDSGLSVLERLKRDPQTRHIPVHMVSVEDHTQSALELGAVGYTVKPPAREQIVHAFEGLKARLAPGERRVLVVEDDPKLRESIGHLLRPAGVEILEAGSVADALGHLSRGKVDCMVMDLALPDGNGFELLEKVGAEGKYASPPVIVYTGRALSPEDEQRLRKYSRSIIIKGARSPERLLDEVTLFLHRVESALPPDQQKLLRQARQRDAVLDGRRILLAEDDVRNIYALSSVLEPLGVKLEIARNGREALDLMTAGGAERIDLVLMDIMMPEMNGLTAMREIRKLPGGRVPIIALTAKAMPEDRQACLDAGANDYIPKPIDMDRLISLCRVWMPK